MIKSTLKNRFFQETIENQASKINQAKHCKDWSGFLDVLWFQVGWSSFESEKTNEQVSAIQSWLCPFSNFLFCILVILSSVVKKRGCLIIHRSDLHFSSFSWILFPIIPPYTVWTSVISVMIDTIQVAVMTVVIPPGSFPLHSTVIVTITVVILVFCWKWITIVISQRISSSS